MDFVDDEDDFDRFVDSLDRTGYELVIELLSAVKPIGSSLDVPTVIGLVTNSHSESVEYRENAVVVRGLVGDGVRYFDVLYFHPVEGVVRERHAWSNVDSTAGYRLTIDETTYFVHEYDHSAVDLGAKVQVEAAGPRLDLF